MLGVTTHGALTCDRFRMIYGAATNKVMASDENGFGIWTDVSNFNDGDWFFNKSKNLYTNAPYVGIGTISPQSHLHVVDGNILVSLSATDTIGNHKGNVLFGEVIDATCPLGEWGIRYNANQCKYPLFPTT